MNLTVLGYLILISIDSYNSVEQTYYQTLKTVCDDISKHLQSRQTYSSARRIFFFFYFKLSSHCLEMRSKECFVVIDVQQQQLNYERMKLRCECRHNKTGKMT